MPGSNRFARTLRRSVAALGCSLLLGGCASWAEHLDFTPAPQGAVPGTIRVTRKDGFSAVLDDALVRDDSLIGTVRGKGDRAAIALSDIRRVDDKELNSFATLGVVAIAAAAAFGVWAFMSLAGGD